MAHKGKIIDNPVTGERITFLQTAQDTNGQLLQMDMVVKPTGCVASEHVHPGLEERLAIISGTCMFRVNGKEQIFSTGETVIVPPDTPHYWCNAGTEEAHLVLEFRPASQMEASFETWFGLARDGKTDAYGVPNLLQLAVIVQEFWNDVQPNMLPPMLRKPFFWSLAFIGKLFGYRARYPQYSE